MILTNRLFDREPPSEDAKSIFIFCEGAKREKQYFNYFKDLDSRINIEVYPLDADENNSPIGLYQIAKEATTKSEGKPEPKYDLREGDEVWIVIDFDLDKSRSRMPQINKILDEIEERPNWHLSQSNPCFEVWLYYHVFTEKPEFEGDKYCKGWKMLLSEKIRGGFDPRKHPIFVEEAIVNAKKNFFKKDNYPEVASTELYCLAEVVFSLIEKKIKDIRDFIEE